MLPCKVRSASRPIGIIRGQAFSRELSCSKAYTLGVKGGKYGWGTRIIRETAICRKQLIQQCFPQIGRAIKSPTTSMESK
jgi:hypothetical protein